MSCAVLLCAAFLAGCSKDNVPGGGNGGGNNGGGTEDHVQAISLSAQLQATTKAAIDPGASFTATVCGWESSASVNYTLSPTWLSSAGITANESAREVTLTPARYYSQNGAEKTYMKAWYPAGTPTGGKVAFTKGADYKGDGTDDILLAPEVSGSALDAAMRTLAFGHLCTQLRFTVQGDALFGSTTTVRSIAVKGTGVPTGLDLRTDALVYDAAAGVAVPGIDGSQAVTEQVAQVGESVMVPPFGARTFKIDVVTVNSEGKEIAYRDVVVTVSDNNTLPGKAYTIALTFAGFEVTTQASVTPWNETGTGSGDVTTD